MYLYLVYPKESEEMRSNSLDSKLKAKEVELKKHEQEIADQDEVWFCLWCHDLKLFTCQNS